MAVLIKSEKHLILIVFHTFLCVITGSFHLLHMLLEDYILYTVENHNSADEQSVQSSDGESKEMNFMEGWCLILTNNLALIK